jgi:transcriptional antiterminator NusG
LQQFSSKDANIVTSWSAIGTRANFEARTATDLQNLGFEVFYPRTNEVHEWNNRMRRVTAPLFPGYVFVRFEPTGINQLNILQARGAKSIVGDSRGNPKIIDPLQIQVLQRLVDSGLLLSRHPQQASGERTRIKSGVLRGIEGRLIRHRNESRLVVTLDLLGQSVSVHLRPQDTEVPGPATTELDRRIA